MFAEAVPVPDIQHGTGLVVRAAGNDTVSCGFDGNSDFYGLGIRLGIYLQWITTLLAHLFFDEAIPGNLELNCVFLIAVSAATLVATRAGTVRPAECLVLLHLCFGFVFSVLSIWGHRIDMRFSLAGSSFRLALAAAISAYAVWFWSRGLGLLTVDACPAFTFVVVPRVVSAAIATFYKAQSSVVLAVYSLLLARELLTAFCFFVFCAMVSGVFAEFHATVVQWVRPSSDSHGHHLNHVLRMWAVMTMTVFWAYFNGQKSAGVYRPSLSAYVLPVVDVTVFVWWSAWQLLYLLVIGRSPPPGSTYPPLVSSRLLRRRRKEAAGPGNVQTVFELIRKLIASTKILFLVNVSCLAWAVVAIEITLQWNSVSGVYDIATTGQLIPFIIGVVSVLRLFLALTVQSTTQYVTNLILQLFDKKHAVDSDEEGPPGETRVLNEDFAYPISPRHEAVFWNRIRSRRQSLGTDPEPSEKRSGKVTYFQIFEYNGRCTEYYSDDDDDDDDDDAASDEASNVNREPAPSRTRGLGHQFRGSGKQLWEFDNAEFDQRTAITLVGRRIGSYFPDAMKRIWIKPAWEGDLDPQVSATCRARRFWNPLVRHTDPSQQPANHPERTTTGSADNGSLGPDNLADLPPGRIHSHYFTSAMQPVSHWRAGSYIGSEGGQKTNYTGTPSKRIAGFRVLIKLSFTVLGWIFSEQRILWAFEQYGLLLSMNIFQSLWQPLRKILGLQPDEETQSQPRPPESAAEEQVPSQRDQSQGTQSQARPSESAGEEDRPSQDQSQGENPRGHRRRWGPHRRILGETAWDEMKRTLDQASYSLLDHLESLHGILSTHLQARGLTQSAAALQSIKRLADDLSRTRREFVSGGIGLEEQHVRARAQWYSCLHRLDGVEWGEIAGTEIQTVLDQEKAYHDI